jgi:hypothetical protein
LVGTTRVFFIDRKRERKSFCRLRGRPRLGGSGNQKFEDRIGLHLNQQLGASGGKARAETAAIGG